jgi:DNA repair exonuclease SbcCD nuclease subunit
MKRRFLDEDAQARFDQARFDAIRRIGELAARERCECIAVCGDVFESNAVDRRTVARALDAFRELPVPLVLLPGNHDPLDGASVFDAPGFREHAPDGVHVLRDAAPLVIHPGLEIVGAPWASKRPGRDLLAEALAGLPADPARTRVALAHGAVDVLSPDRDDPAAIALAGAESAIRAGRIHYLALGDRHSRTRVGDTDRIHYAGTPEPTDWGEIDPGQVLVVDVDASHVEVEPHRMGLWRFERQAFPLCGADDLDALEAWLAEQPDKERTVLRLSFEGTLDLRGRARLDAALERARDLFACVDVWEPDCDLAVLPEDADFEALSLSGFAARAVERLRAEAAALGDGAEEAADALALLVRLAGGGSGTGRA